MLEKFMCYFCPLGRTGSKPGPNQVWGEVFGGDRGPEGYFWWACSREHFWRLSCSGLSGWPPNTRHSGREQKIRNEKCARTFFGTNLLKTPRGPGHPGKIRGTSEISLFETQGRQTFEGGRELFGHRPSAWKTTTPPGGLRTPKVNLCGALFSGLRKWATSPVRLGLSGRNSGKTPERPRKRSQSVSWNSPREYGWDAPSPIIQGI